MTTDKQMPDLKPCRDAFENWYVKSIGRDWISQDKHGFYESIATQMRWETWQAAWQSRADLLPAIPKADLVRAGMWKDANLEYPSSTDPVLVKCYRREYGNRKCFYYDIAVWKNREWQGGDQYTTIRPFEWKAIR